MPACRLDAVLTDRQVAEPQSPSPEPELPRLPERPKLPGPPKLLEPEPVASSVVAKLTKRKRPDQASSETSSGTWRASTGKHPNGAAQEQSEDSEANDTLPEEHRPDRGRRSEHPSDGRYASAQMLQPSHASGICCDWPCSWDSLMELRHALNWSVLL